MYKLRKQTVLLVLIVMLGILVAGCTVDANVRATAFDGKIDDTAQTSLASGRAARD